MPAKFHAFIIPQEETQVAFVYYTFISLDTTVNANTLAEAEKVIEDYEIRTGTS